MASHLSQTVSGQYGEKEMEDRTKTESFWRETSGPTGLGSHESQTHWSMGGLAPLVGSDFPSWVLASYVRLLFKKKKQLA